MGKNNNYLYFKNKIRYFWDFLFRQDGIDLCSSYGINVSLLFAKHNINPGNDTGDNKKGTLKRWKEGELVWDPNMGRTG